MANKRERRTSLRLHLPLFLFNQFGDLERCSLRPGNVHSADGWREVLEPVVERYRERNLRRYFRGDAAFAAPDIYEFLESEGFLYAIRLPKNQILQENPPRRSSAEPCAALLRQLQVSGWKLGQEAARGGQGGMAPPSCAPASALLSPTCRGPPNGWWRFIITVGQRSSTSRKANTPSSGPGCHAASSATTRSAPVSRPGLQSGQLHADACIAEGGGTLVADHATGKAGEDQSCPPWPLVTFQLAEVARSSLARSTPNRPRKLTARWKRQERCVLCRSERGQPAAIGGLRREWIVAVQCRYDCRWEMSG